MVEVKWSDESNFEWFSQKITDYEKTIIINHLLWLNICLVSKLYVLS